MIEKQLLLTLLLLITPYTLAMEPQKHVYSSKKTEELRTQFKKYGNGNSVCLMLFGTRPELKELILEGANPNITSCGYTPLLSCAALNTTESSSMIPILLEHGADPNAVCYADNLSLEDQGGTPFTVFLSKAFQEQLALAQEFINFGANIHHRNSKGNSLLMNYFIKDDPKKTMLLLENGAAIDIPILNNDGQCVLDVATNPQVVSLLKDHTKQKIL